jgi:integrase
MARFTQVSKTTSVWPDGFRMMACTAEPSRLTASSRAPSRPRGTLAHHDLLEIGFRQGVYRQRLRQQDAREWCDAAELPDCTSHGLRKLMMVRLAHAGYSAPQIGAISGHKDLREIQLYIEQMDRAKTAIDTMTDFEQVEKANKNLLTGGAS